MRVIVGLVACCASACTKPTGGAQGPRGASCSVFDNGNGTKTIACEDGSSVLISDGAKGADGVNGADGAPGAVGDAGPQGPAGLPGESVAVSPLMVGDAQCPEGGASFKVGSNTAYACNGLGPRSYYVEAASPAVSSTWTNIPGSEIQFTLLTARDVDLLAIATAGAPGIAANPVGLQISVDGIGTAEAYWANGSSGGAGAAGTLSVARRVRLDGGTHDVSMNAIRPSGLNLAAARLWVFVR